MHPKYKKTTSALITGGSSGIGKAIATEAVRRGINVFLVARTEKTLEETAKQLRAIAKNSQVAVMSASVTDPDALAVAVQQAEAAHGPIDLLVNSAGVTTPGYFEDLPLSAFSTHIEINYLGTVKAIRAVLPTMKKNGRGWIVNLSSVAGYKGFFGYTSYCGSKFAVTGFSEALRAELSRYGIGVSLVCPPDTRTPRWEGEENLKPEETKRMASRGTVLEPDKVAQDVWAGLQRSRFWITPGWEASFLRTANRFFPSTIDRVLNRIAGLHRPPKAQT